MAQQSTVSVFEDFLTFEHASRNSFVFVDKGENWIYGEASAEFGGDLYTAVAVEFGGFKLRELYGLGVRLPVGDYCRLTRYVRPNNN